MIEDKKIGENEKAIFYTNLFCNIRQKDFKIFIAEEKETGAKEWILLYKDEPIYSHTNIEEIYCKIDQINMINQFKKKGKK